MTPPEASTRALPEYSFAFLTSRQAASPLTPATCGYCGAEAWPREYIPSALTWGHWGGATPRQYALLLRSLKLTSPWEWEELSSEHDGICVFAFRVFLFIFIFFSSLSEPEPGLFETAPAQTKMFRRLRLRPKCASSGSAPLIIIFQWGTLYFTY